MAQGSDTKLYVALGVLALLGAGYYSQKKADKELDAAHSVAGAEQNLPELALKEEQTGKITKIVIETPAKGEGDKAKAAGKNVLVKTGDTWKLDEPVKALANQKNVESLLANLTKLEAKEQVAPGKSAYEQYDLSDGKALHAVFYEGDKVVREVWAGKSGGRGQMARVDGSEAVYVIDGFSSYLYKRDTKGWRDLAILTLDPEEVTSVSITNENGEFSFSKPEAKDAKKDGADEDEDASEWSGKFKGDKSPIAKDIKEFESKKITSLLSAYKKLSASGFGDKKTLAEAGLEEPAATLLVSLGEEKTIEIHFGQSAEGSSRWAQVVGDEQIYSVSSWASDWAFAKEEKFQKSDEPEAPPGPPGGMPPGMQMPPGMMGGPR